SEAPSSLTSGNDGSSGRRLASRRRLQWAATWRIRHCRKRSRYGQAPCSTLRCSASPLVRYGRGRAASCPDIWPRSYSLRRTGCWSNEPVSHNPRARSTGPWTLLAVVTAIFALDSGEDPSAYRHLLLVPPVWAALSLGSRAGSVVGIVAGLLQAPFAL